ncbi:protein of unknown function [Nakamurella panacisegetis]|uniref:DUF4145 domain-containing protein n=1 Tax=Nakamurella panacisegetis TaxID=1090615 RepID=A0A1H0PXT2_9ACTN|nr:protein of unknown function [Nakamurella panacisegetis]
MPHPAVSAFTCPHCRTRSQQILLGPVRGSLGRTYNDNDIPNWLATKCFTCHNVALFHGPTLRFPAARVGPTPTQDMPANIKAIYEEAQEVAAVSPRSAAALLRVALETMVNELVSGSEKLFQKIGKLRALGVDQEIIDYMDLIRGFGNDGAHAGEVNLEDDPKTVADLFEILQIIVADAITRKKKKQALLGRFSQGWHQGREERDAAAQAKADQLGSKD